MNSRQRDRNCQSQPGYLKLTRGLVRSAMREATGQEGGDGWGPQMHPEGQGIYWERLGAMPPEGLWRAVTRSGRSAWNRLCGRGGGRSGHTNTPSWERGTSTVVGTGHDLSICPKVCSEGCETRFAACRVDCMKFMCVHVCAGYRCRVCVCVLWGNTPMPV